MKPSIVMQAGGERYGVAFGSSQVTVTGPSEAVSRAIALIVRQSLQSYSPAYGDRVGYIAQQIAVSAGMQITSVQRSSHEQGVVY